MDHDWLIQLVTKYLGFNIPQAHSCRKAVFTKAKLSPCLPRIAVSHAPMAALKLMTFGKILATNMAANTPNPRCHWQPFSQALMPAPGRFLVEKNNQTNKNGWWTAVSCVCLYCWFYIFFGIAQLKMTHWSLSGFLGQNNHRFIKAITRVLLELEAVRKVSTLIFKKQVDVCWSRRDQFILHIWLTYSTQYTKIKTHKLRFPYHPYHPCILYLPTFSWCLW